MDAHAIFVCCMFQWTHEPHAFCAYIKSSVPLNLILISFFLWVCGIFFIFIDFVILTKEFWGRLYNKTSSSSFRNSGWSWHFKNLQEGEGLLFEKAINSCINWKCLSFHQKSVCMWMIREWFHHSSINLSHTHTKS